MKKETAKKIAVYCVLAFVLFLYVFSILVFLFGKPEAGIATFAYSTFFTIVVYFLFVLHKRSRQ